MGLFTKRNAPPPTQLRYDLPDQVRTRILAAFQDLCGEQQGGFDGLLREVGDRLFKEYGGLRASSYEAARRSNNPVIEHFYCCRPEEALDFIEACFQPFVYRGGQRGVDEINAIFREHGIGFELTAYVQHEVKKETSFFGRLRPGIVIETEYPRVIPRADHLVHTEVVEPTLKLLTNSKLRVANTEMLKAHAALRLGEFEDAITLCGSAFESVLKTICDLKKWPYDANRDTCAKLVGICRDNGLFPAFYAPIFESVGTIRNKLGDVHGRGPTPQHSVTQEQAEHMLRATAAHVLLLAKLAGLG
ncbi:MAG: hypothetical protein IPM64_07880 [Phycisphaerales bacterium]|nr:hypothetical protein [Phycisphaerales bacterium]